MNIHSSSPITSDYNTQLRTITAKCIPKHDKLDFSPLNTGPAPMLQWLPVHMLVIDDTYQRAMGSLAWRHIVEIAKSFDWSKFTPVIAAPVEGGFYAIIDGQHRTTAAFLRDIKTVPCQVVQADRHKQAAAFAAINAKITRLTQNTIFHAQLESGDPFARRVLEVCIRAGVKIPRHKPSTRDLPPNGTVAISSLKAIVAAYGDETAITALQCVVETGNGNPGMLKGVLMRALAEVLAQRPIWREAGEGLFRALDDIDFQEQIHLADQDSKSGIDTTLSSLVRRIGSWLDARVATALSCEAG
ncbi:ParB N-terminal domain-containing protein [Chelatococcus sp. GCM10030263]|uniref:ParB N-terminal domain-containing protein n=1 Tax=Chelatococcus sp. GCM10030263 TaxID=3273387 RepID=UPI00361D89F5